MSDKLTVQEAWAAVMADVQGLGKNQAVTSGPARFNFRGVDDVMNAVGPVLRTHGVSVVPTEVTHSPENVTTSNGKGMRNVTVFVKYAIHGPAGDTMAGAAAGEAADSGDKATPKAMSVAFRTFLLQALCLPTNEPDPDEHQYERAAPPAEITPDQRRAMILQGLGESETEAAVREWGNRAHAFGLLDDALKATVDQHLARVTGQAVAS
ncbi:ERF superfamily protein [Nocardioides sp. YR527]|uniref:ERF family protein n=1 Tax=Nocardioides sp. YR527 TaxID=1881028 RepID=UPI0008837126|nr:ERF family protein [Nocardioides sp. YR527]SDL15339.1 ERF superfamily protein [Nocardioides sp. YR527]